MRINNRGYWEDMTKKDIQREHAFDQPLCDQLKQFFTNEHIDIVVDLGCGLGNYTEQLNTETMVCDGYDGNPNTVILTNQKCKVLDLSKKHTFEKKYDWVLSLEVGEHLPKQYEDTFINNICDNCIYGMVISWAMKGQGGKGHFNEQDNEYVVDEIDSRGFKHDVKSSNVLRDKSSLWWFKNTLMVFRKEYDDENIFIQPIYKISEDSKIHITLSVKIIN